MSYMGQARPGLHNRRLVAGRGRFTADVERPNACWMALARTPHASARILEIDTSEAEAVPGVVKILLGEELARETRPLTASYNPERGGGKRLSFHALSVDHVHFVGQPVAAVVATDRHAAHLACERIVVDYEQEPVVTDAVEALEPDAPVVIPEWEDNLVYRTEYNQGDVAAGLAEASGTVSGSFKTQRYLSSPIEPRSYLADFDPYEEMLTVWSSTQMPHPARGTLSRCLGLPETSIRVVQGDVGGGFGTKSPGSSEEILVAYLSHQLQRPVRWVEERQEYFLSCGHARETLFEFDAGFTDDGRLLALDIRVTGDVGSPTGLAWVQSYVTAYCLPCAYKVPNCRVRLHSVATNKCGWAGYRGFGKETATQAMDRILDRVADATGIDRLEVRLRNFIPPDEFPYSQVSGAMLDSGDYPTAMRRLAEMVDRDAFRAEQEAARQEGRHLGLGFAFELTPEGCSMPHNPVLQGYDGATVRVGPSGRVTVLTGVTSPGSGNETGIAQIVADALGVRFDDVRVIQGDTDTCPYGLGNFSSRSLMIGGSAALEAANELRDKLFRVAGNALEVAEEDLVSEDGEIRVKGSPDRSIPIRKVASMIYTNAFGREALEVEPGLESTRYFRVGNVYHQPETQGRFSAYPTWPYMACAAVVEVDPTTGLVKVVRYYGVHDCGTVINPMLVEGNLHGGIAQGLGGALYEDLVYDENGQLLTTTFMDYTLPTAVEMPAEVITEHQVTPTEATPLGTKGAGESGIAGPISAIASAIEDAFPDLDLELMEMPLQPERVWQAIQAAQNQGAEDPGAQGAARPGASAR